MERERGKEEGDKEKILRWVEKKDISRRKRWRGSFVHFSIYFCTW